MTSHGLSRLGVRLCKLTLRRKWIKTDVQLRMLTAADSHRLPVHCQLQTIMSPSQNSFHGQQISRGFSSHYDKWTELTYEDLVALLDSGDIQLFDVREPKEIDETGLIPRAVNIPLGDIKGALKMNDARFTEHYKVAKPQPHDTNLVFYGLGPIKSSAALEIAHKLGFKNLGISLTVGELVSALDLADDEFKSKYGMKKPQEDDSDIVFYCQRGFRGNRATVTAHSLGFHTARHYSGGYDEWSAKQNMKK